LGSKTPEEMFTSKKPKVSHFRIFGSHVYFHVLKEKRNKLGASGKKGMTLSELKLVENFQSDCFLSFP